MFFKKMTDEEIVARGEGSFQKGYVSFDSANGALLTITALTFPIVVGGAALVGAVIGLAAGGLAGLGAGLLIGAGVGCVPTGIALGKALIAESGNAIDNKLKRFQTNRQTRQYNAAFARLQEKYESNPQAMQQAITDAFNKRQARVGRTPLERATNGRSFKP